MADTGAERRAIAYRPVSLRAIAGRTKRPDIRARSLRAVPFHRQSQREPSHNLAAVPHLSSEIPDRKPASTPRRGNRPGAGGNIGTEAVVRAPADGYTILLAATLNTINATLYDKLNYNFIRDIAPV